MIEKMLEINGEKLKQIINKKGFTLSDTSKICGLNESYISHSCNRGTIKESVVDALRNKLGIVYNDYKKDKLDIDKVLKRVEDYRNEQKNEQKTIGTLGKKELEYAIYRAVYAAIIHAMETNKMKELQ